MIAKHIEKLNSSFLYDIQSAMEIRKSDVDKDYFHLIDSTFLRMGLCVQFGIFDTLKFKE